MTRHHSQSILAAHVAEFLDDLARSPRSHLVAVVPLTICDMSVMGAATYIVTEYLVIWMNEE